MELENDIEKVTTDNARTQVERQVRAADRELDDFVFRLYGLEKDEVALVESTDNVSPDPGGKAL
jgi:hypothetical protein